MAKYKTLTGYLRQVSDGSFYMDTEDGTVEAVELLGMEVPFNKLIALSVQNIEGKYWVGAQTPCYTLIQQAEADPIPKKHIMLFKVIKTDASEEHEENQQIVIDDAAIFLQNYYRYYSGDRWDIQVRGYVIRYDGYNVPPKYMRNRVDEFIENRDMKGFEPNYFHGWGGKFNREMCGLADLGGNRAATRDYIGNCGLRTIVHEQGHNFNLPHAGLRKVDGSVSEYGDKTSIMGSSQRGIEGHHSYHMVKLGWYEDREIKVIETSQQVLIAPIEMPYHGMHPNEFQHVILKSPGTVTEPAPLDVYISTRKVRGTLYPQPARNEGLLYLHEVDHHKKTKLLEPPMKVGETRTLQSGAAIQYFQYANETARVSVLCGTGNAPPDPLEIPEGLPAPIPSASITPAHSGAWYNANLNGQGFDIYVREDGLVVLYWYTYSDDGSGLPVWYTASGNITDGCVEMPLYTTEGGTFDDPTTRKNILVGDVQLYFLGDNRGVVNWNTSDYGRGGVEITPIVLTSHELDGSYFQPDKVGSGFGFRFWDDQCTGYWYNFSNDGKQRWWSCQGELGISGVYEITLREFLGGRWMYYDEPMMDEVGTAFLNPNTMQFEYHIDAFGVSDEGILNLIKLA